MILGRVTNREITTTRESDRPVLLLQVELTSERDVQDAELFTDAGVDSSPHDDDLVIVLSLADAYQLAIGVDDGIEPEVAEGEKEIYSYEAHGGPKLAKTRWNSDGEVIHNDGERLVARKDDETTSDITIDETFWTWIAAVGSALGLTPPESFTGKINDGTDEVKVP
jgi:hypothetical protein